MSDVERLVSDILAVARIEDPQQRELLARTATRAVELATRAALGENVDAELAIVDATAKNFSTFVRRQTGDLILAFVQRQIFGALTKMALT